MWMDNNHCFVLCVYVMGLDRALLRRTSLWYRLVSVSSPATSPTWRFQRSSSGALARCVSNMSLQISMVAQHSHSEFVYKLIKDTGKYVSKLISKATAIEIKIKINRNQNKSKTKSKSIEIKFKVNRNRNQNQNKAKSKSKQSEIKIKVKRNQSQNKSKSKSKWNEIKIKTKSISIFTAWPSVLIVILRLRFLFSPRGPAYVLIVPEYCCKVCGLRGGLLLQHRSRYSGYISYENVGPRSGSHSNLNLKIDFIFTAWPSVLIAGHLDRRCICIDKPPRQPQALQF